MTQQQLLEKIKQTKIVPVVVLNSIEETLPKMQALVNGRSEEHRVGKEC